MTCPSSTLRPTFRTNISWHQSQIQAIESCLMFCFNFHGSILYLQNSRWKQFVSFSPGAHKEEFPSLATSTSGYQVMDRDDSFRKWIVGQDFNSCGKILCFSIYFNDLTSKQQSNMSNASLTCWHLWNLDVKGSLRRSHPPKIRRLRCGPCFGRNSPFVSFCVAGFRSHLSWL